MSAAAREKLEKAGLVLNRSPSDILNRIVDAMEEVEITEIVTVKLKPEPESQAGKKSRRRIIIKSKTTHRFSL